MKNIMQPQEFIQLAKKAGFRNVKYIDTTHLIEKSLRILRKKMYMVYIPARILEIIGLRNKYQKENMRSPTYCYESYKGHLWKYGLIYAEK